MCTKNGQNSSKYLYDFWRENSNIFTLKLNVARFARNVVKNVTFRIFFINLVQACNAILLPKVVFFVDQQNR